MHLEPAREIAPGVVLVDAGYVRPKLAACYVVRGGASAAVVDTAASSSVPRILEALAAFRIAPADVSHVIVTHVHLDHAGGAGKLMQALPNATLVAHPRGARHLVDPSKLIAGTAEVYGEARFRELYGEIPPIAAARVVEAPDGFEVDLGGRVLRLLDAPGHAKHHLAVHDAATRGFFTGDAFGLSYREADSAKGPFVFPTTTPVQLDPSALRGTVARLLAEQPERIYLTHFGMLEGDIPSAARQLLAALDEHVRLARAVPSGSGRHAALRDALGDQLLRGLAAHGAPLSREEALAVFGADLELNAQGLEVWLDAQAAKA